DGFSNVREVGEHTDPFTDDLDFRSDHAYGYIVKPTEPATGGRACYQFYIHNFGLVETKEVKNGTQGDGWPSGANRIRLTFFTSPETSPGSPGVQRSRDVCIMYDPKRPRNSKPDTFVITDPNSPDGGTECYTPEQPIDIGDDSWQTHR